MFKMIAFDLDGTLLKEDKTISKNSIKIINELIDKDILFAICSGRPIIKIKKYIEQFNFNKNNTYMVSINGAKTTTYDENIIYEKYLTKKDLIYVLNKYKDSGISIYIYDELGLGYFIYDKFIKLEYDLNKIFIHKISLDDLNENSKIYKIMLAAEKNIIDNMIISKEDLKKYNVVRSSDIYYEYLNKECDKFYGIKAITEKNNIDLLDVITFGDAYNDHLMIKNTYGIAMGNAYSKIKEDAKYITKDNESDGIYYALKNFFK